MLVYHRPCSMLYVIRHWVAVYAVSVSFFIPVINGKELKSIQCEDLMPDSRSSSCDPEIVSGHDVVCNFTCNTGCDTDVDTLMCQDVNLTANSTICIQCEDLMPDSRSSCNDVICNITCDTGCDIDVDTLMCQDVNLTANPTICTRNSSDHDFSDFFSTKNIAIIAGGVSLFIILVICIVLIAVCCCCRRRKSSININTNPENGYNGDTDIPYISHEGDTHDALYYNTTANVKIQPNPSYDVNLCTGMEASGEQYVFPDSPGNNKVADDIYYGVTEDNTAPDDVYDNVSGVHEYLAVTK